MMISCERGLSTLIFDLFIILNMTSTSQFAWLAAVQKINKKNLELLSEGEYQEDSYELVGQSYRQN